MREGQAPPDGWSPKTARPVATPPALPLTGPETDAVIHLLEAMDPRPVTLVTGSSRDAPARRAAALLAGRWQERGGEVIDAVDWPEDAASWLRQARRFTRAAPDAWLVTGRLTGWVQMGRRLTVSTTWNPARTVATSGLAHDDLISGGGIGTFDGLRGAHRDGGTWEIIRTLRVDHPAPAVRAKP
ncbi:hypothetical protein [Streptomyces pinistramenti]|uniref:hypothetical protein n=1 Tax=Streptomyces pinistramenti TaxID=2884812 RepID=UPI001D05C2A1|nr:hypothetical protein [Streptomyces pinistramenti]MCB5909105.1 hypothetical protein [Streptomyces pinistramenti]